MLKLTKKGDKYWLFEDSQIGLFSPSKFTINLELNEIVIVYENGLKSKRYNVSDCEIYDLGELTPFTTSSGDLFMQKLEELNCPCFQKNENIYNIYGGGDLQQTTDLGNTTNKGIELNTEDGLSLDFSDGITKQANLNATSLAFSFYSYISTFFANFYYDNLTANRDYILPDEDGTIATQEWVTANAGGSNVITEINTTGTASSGTAETITYSVLIPANTMSVGVYDAITRVNKTGTAGTVTVKIYVNDTNNLTTPILIGSTVSTATGRYLPLQKFVDIKVLNGTGLGTEVANNVNSASFQNDLAQHGNTGGMSNVAIDWTIDQYLIVTVTNSNAGDSSTGTFLILKK